MNERNMEKENMILQQKLAEANAQSAMWQAWYDDALEKLDQYEKQNEPQQPEVVESE